MIDKLTYVPVEFKQVPDTSTPVNAKNLNTMDSGVKYATAKLNELIDAVEDTKNSTVTFESSDVDDQSATTWSTVEPLLTKESHTSIFAKISQMFKNIRYLKKMYEQLNSDLMNYFLNDNMAIIKTATINDSASGVAYPSGYSRNNCIVLSYSIWSTSQSGYIVNPDTTACFTRDGNVRIYTADATYRSQPAIVVLLKIS